jgi:hypothetical protein
LQMRMRSTNVTRTGLCEYTVVHKQSERQRERERERERGVTARSTWYTGLHTYAHEPIERSNSNLEEERELCLSVFTKPGVRHCVRRPFRPAAMLDALWCLSESCSARGPQSLASDPFLVLVERVGSRKVTSQAWWCQARPERNHAPVAPSRKDSPRDRAH